MFHDGIGTVLAELDPNGARPVFGWPRSQGYDYFYRRPNPTPTTVGLTFTAFNTDRTASLVLSATPPALVILVRNQRSAWPDARLRLDRWEKLDVPGPAHTELAKLQPLRRLCAEVEHDVRPIRELVLVLDCAKQPGHDRLPDDPLVR